MILVRPELAKRPRPGEAIIQAFLFLCGAISIFTTLGIVYELGKEAWLFFGSPEVRSGGISDHHALAAFDWSIWGPAAGKCHPDDQFFCHAGRAAALV
jgi:ABC-type phosphate transport system permease subunit